MARRITSIKLVDGRKYQFAEVPTSPGLALKLIDAAAGVKESDIVGMKDHIRAIKLSLELAGNDAEKCEDIVWRIDWEDGEVVRAVKRAVFPADIIEDGTGVDAPAGVVRQGVGDDAKDARGKSKRR